MATSSESKNCPKCGGSIPERSPQGLCPKCLLLQASIATEAEAASASKEAPPTREELAAAFPQLEILELIGQGGMGLVFKARQPKLDRLVALKILPQSLAGDPAFAERFAREGRTLARLNHPNIVTIHDFGQANGFFYLLMEFVGGVNLRQAMKVGRFTPSQALAVVPRICEALQFAHDEGVLHRDIKPENILLDSKGRVKIADFGIAKLMAAEMRSPAQSMGAETSAAAGKGTSGQINLTETGKSLGTPHYMAPEQLEHPQDVDQRADIYSLGVVFYEMLTGELPIGRFAPPSEKSTVDPRVDQVVLRTLEKERERRTQSAGEVKTQVETITGATSVPVPSNPQAAPVPVKRSWTTWTTWTPFQSPQEQEVCSHMTKPERDKMGWLLLLFGLGIALQALALITFLDNFKETFNHTQYSFTIAFTAGAICVALGTIWLRLWRSMSRKVICSTRWFREQGLSPQQVRMSAFRGRDLWKPLGIFVGLILLFFAQSKELGNYLAKQKNQSQGALPWKQGSASPEAANLRDVDSMRPLNRIKSLHSGTGVAKNSSSFAFSPIAERELAVWEAIDLDTGKIATQGLEKHGGVDGYFPFQYLRAGGFDLYVSTSQGLDAAEIKLKRVSNESWGSMTASQTVLAVESISDREPALTQLGTNTGATYCFQTREGGIGIVQVVGPFSIRYKLALPIPAPVREQPSPDALAELRLVITTLKPQLSNPEPGGMYWNFNCFVPPNHLASFIFVQWTNGAASVDSIFSRYFKVRSSGGIDMDCYLSCYPIPESHFDGLTDAKKRESLARWGLTNYIGVANLVQWNMNFGSGSTASAWRSMPPGQALESTPFTRREVREGHQGIYPLVDFVQSKTGQSAGKSGIELRVFLEPLRGPAIRTTSNETDRTNYIHGFGLAMPMEKALEAIKECPMEQ